MRTWIGLVGLCLVAFWARLACAEGVWVWPVARGCEVDVGWTEGVRVRLAGKGVPTTSLGAVRGVGSPVEAALRSLAGIQTGPTAPKTDRNAMAAFFASQHQQPIPHKRVQQVAHLQKRLAIADQIRQRLPSPTQHLSPRVLTRRTNTRRSRT